MAAAGPRRSATRECGERHGLVGPPLLRPDAVRPPQPTILSPCFWSETFGQILKYRTSTVPRCIGPLDLPLVGPQHSPPRTTGSAVGLATRVCIWVSGWTSEPCTCQLCPKEVLNRFRSHYQRVRTLDGKRSGCGHSLLSELVEDVTGRHRRDRGHLKILPPHLVRTDTYSRCEATADFTSWARATSSPAMDGKGRGARRFRPGRCESSAGAGSPAGRQTTPSARG